jgi:hypothetical protein
MPGVFRKVHLAGKEAERSQHSRRQERFAHHPGKSAFDSNPGRRHNSWMLHHRYVGPRCRGVRRSAAAGWGMPLAIGACIGRVVRLLPNGFAVKFVEKQNRHDLNGSSPVPYRCFPRAMQGCAFSGDAGGGHVAAWTASQRRLLSAPRIQTESTSLRPPLRAIRTPLTKTSSNKKAGGLCDAPAP